MVLYYTLKQNIDLWFNVIFWRQTDKQFKDISIIVADE